MEYSLSLQMSEDSHKLKPPPHPQSSTTSSYSSLHSIRKPAAKPWRRPELPQPKVYRVDPHGFRGLVQRLTGMPRQLKDTVAAPPPIKVGAQMPMLLLQQQHPVNLEVNHESGGGAGMHMGMLSPSFYSSWCSFPLLSPGSMAALDS